MKNLFRNISIALTLVLALLPEINAKESGLLQPCAGNHEKKKLTVNSLRITCLTH